MDEELEKSNEERRKIVLKYKLGRENNDINEWVMFTIFKHIYSILKRQSELKFHLFLLYRKILTLVCTLKSTGDSFYIKNICSVFFNFHVFLLFCLYFT